ncbi:MAG TPA: 16S rRNA (uracil(1498)-N(3))-methyltransferase [Xanthomonadaceae bacterium]|nr:16S rRNA (uracil(1498)-N(3))-methyltransferase [Xanthomonadaceae bacterium]
MRRIRTYIDAALTPGATLLLPEAASSHLTRVLRLSVGARLLLFNGDGNDYEAELVATPRRGAEVRVLAAGPAAAPESPLRMTLAQALARGEKMDLVLQKATELGARRVVPLLTGRTEVRLEGERLVRRMAHWRGVLAAACEQCGRARLPALDEPVALPRFAAAADPAALRLALLPAGERAVADCGGHADIVLVVGPEGGLSEADEQVLRAAGFAGLRLGPRILRTETAGLAALAALAARFGDWT